MVVVVFVFVVFVVSREGLMEEEAILVALPAELIERILWHAVHPATHTLESYRHLAFASTTCRQLHENAEAAWRALVLSLLAPGQQWIGPSPQQWSRCLQQLSETASLHSLTAHKTFTDVDGRQFANCFNAARSRHIRLPRRTFAHSTVQWRERLYLWGGRDSDAFSNELHVLPLRAALDMDHPPGGDMRMESHWESPPTSGTPPAPRRAHTATVHGHRMHVLGGGTTRPGETFGDHHVLDLATLRWSERQPPRDWLAFGHTCVLAEGCRRSSEGAGADGGGGVGPGVGVEEGGLVEALREAQIGAAAAAAAAAHGSAAGAAGAAEPREAETMAQSTAGGEGAGDTLIVFGGAWLAEGEGLSVTDRTVCCDLTSGRWREALTAGEPPESRYRHAACLVGSGDARSMAVWGGYVLYLRGIDTDHPNTIGEGDAAHSVVGALNSSEPLTLLRLQTFEWSSPRCLGVPPSPRGGHAMCAVGAKLVILGGGDLRCDTRGQLHERDVDDVAVLDMRGPGEWTYAWPVFPPSERPAARGGATVTLVPMGEYGLSLLVLGGRQFVPPPPHVSWPAGQHLGRDDAHLLALAYPELGPSPYGPMTADEL